MELKQPKLTEKDVNPEQLRMGIEIELEHTNDREVAKTIALHHLDEDPEYYTHLKAMENKYAEKCESKHIEITADGKQTLEPGIEPLKKPSSSQAQHKFVAARAAEGEGWAKEWLHHDKDWKDLPGVKKTALYDRWDSLKKALLDNNSAFMSIKEQTQPEQPEEATAQDAPPEGGVPPSDEQQPTTDQAPDESVPTDDGSNNQEPVQPEQSEQPQDANDEQPELSDDEKEKFIADGMKADGYTDAEIAYVLHGHVPPQATIDDQKMQHEKVKTDISSQLAQQKMEHAKAMHEHEIEHDKKLKESAAEHEQKLRDADLDHQQKLKELELKTKEAELSAKDPELERQHKKRMLDLEYQKAKRELDADDSVGEVEHKRAMREIELSCAKAEAEIELEFKRQEMKLKLEQKKQMHAQGLEHKQELSEIQHQQALKDAKTAKVEPKNKQ